MTNAILAFDTLRYANKLKAAGVPEKQAEVQAEALAEIAEIVDENLATKHDIELIRRDTKELELRLELKIESIKKDILVQLGSLIVGCFGILGTLIIIFHR